MTNFEHDGYTIINDVLTGGQLAEIHDEAAKICREVGYENVTDVLCLHFPHKISDLLLKTAQLPKITETLTDVIGPNVKMMQSMLFIKAAGKPGQAWHQDETHIPTRDRSLTAVWLALDDATTENGCLWVIPGSHRTGYLYPDREQEDPGFDCTKEAHGFTDDQAVPVELKAGDALVFDGHLLHRSLPNTSNGTRRAYVTHYMNAGSLLPWFPPADNESMGTTDHRDIVMVAGVDPYAFKGITDVMRPHIRPAGDGGCVR
ncbi:phytanoyl-CoA dioxygenase family protein [Lentzea sp. PSKA42]|uniref:Phytanoyl-CoA dioxygenase family protein n=1 Tax=Lentzea indica TaxID=2604800 RepID=A0ABX1FSR3_9PSEU|nr:phytanoyl-CoA dioxygenase family protein [Lentzea indica]NKE62093.1 phytanoyl-CoA dioxygenase family protein [Lentzea indica]